MTRTRRAKRLLVATGILGCLLGTAGVGRAAGGRTRVFSVSVDNTGLMLAQFTALPAPACSSWSPYFVVGRSAGEAAPQAKLMYASLLAAYLAGTEIWVNVSDTCDDPSGRPRVTWVNVGLG